MSTHATGTFQLSGWDEQTYEELPDGAKLTRAEIAQDFTGDLAAAGTSQLLMCYSPDGTANYTGYQRMQGTLDDRSGSFVLRADGAFEAGEARTTWSVVPGSGTDDLAGLRGSGESIAPGGPGGTYTFDYDLD